MDYKHQSTTYLEKELMFKNNNKTENKIGKCKLSVASPSQISLEVTEKDGKIYSNYIQSVTTGKFDNMLCVTSQNGITYFFYENRKDRDEWYATIKQLQSGHLPSYPRKRESLPARPPDTRPKSRDRQMPASSPSTLHEIFKKELETVMSPGNLKKPVKKKGSGSYINMDYNEALQHSKESYNMLNVLHGIQNVQVDPAQSGTTEATEDDFYDMPEGDSTDHPIEEQIYEELDDVSDGSNYDDGTEEQIYDVCDDDAEQVYDDTEIQPGARGGARMETTAGARAGASCWDHSQQETADWVPPLPPRPSHIASPEPSGESDDFYEPPACDLPPPLPARPQSATPNVPDSKPGGTRNGKKALQPPSQTQPKTRRKSVPSTKAPFKTGEIIPSPRSRTQSTSNHSLADELALKISQRSRSSTMSNLPSNSQDSNHNHDNVPKIPQRPHVQKSSDVDTDQRRSHDQQVKQNRPNSGISVTDELAKKLAKRSSALLASESTGSGSDGQTPQGLACNSHKEYRGRVPSDDQQGEPMTAPWKQKQDYGNQLPKAPLIHKKKAVVPPPTLAKHGKSPSSLSLGPNKQSPHTAPKPPPKPTQPSPSDDIYEDTAVGPPPPAVKPKPKYTKPGTCVNGEEIDVRIPREAMQSSMAGAVSFRDNSGSVVIERTDLPDYLHVGDQISQIGDIDVRNSSSAFVAECWKRVSETQVRVRVLRR